MNVPIRRGIARRLGILRPPPDVVYEVSLNLAGFYRSAKANEDAIRQAFARIADDVKAAQAKRCFHPFACICSLWEKSP